MVSIGIYPKRIAGAECGCTTLPAGNIPAGMQRMANLWTAPFPAYAPAFVRSAGFGYLLSAMFGVGFLLALSLLMQRCLERRRATRHPS